MRWSPCFRHPRFLNYSRCHLLLFWRRGTSGGRHNHASSAYICSKKMPPRRKACLKGVCLIFRHRIDGLIYNRAPGREPLRMCRTTDKRRLLGSAVNSHPHNTRRNYYCIYEKDTSSCAGSSTRRRCPTSFTSQEAISSAVAPRPPLPAPPSLLVSPAPEGFGDKIFRLSNSVMRPSRSPALSPCCFAALLLGAFLPFRIPPPPLTTFSTPGGAPAADVEEASPGRVTVAALAESAVSDGTRGFARNAFAVRRWSAAASASPGTSSMPRHFVRVLFNVGECGMGCVN